MEMEVVRVRKDDEPDEYADLFEAAAADEEGEDDEDADEEEE